MVMNGLLVQEYSYLYSSGDDNSNDAVTECVLPLEDAQAYFNFAFANPSGSVPYGSATAASVYYNESASVYLTSCTCCPQDSREAMKILAIDIAYYHLSLACGVVTALQVTQSRGAEVERGTALRFIPLVLMRHASTMYPSELCQGSTHGCLTPQGLDLKHAFQGMK